MFRNRIVSLFAAVTLLAVVVVPVMAAGCGEAETDLWENTGYNGNGIAVCNGTSIPDMGAVGYPGGGNWDNRISSAQFDEKTVNVRACAYTELNYIGNIWNPQSDTSTQWFFGGDVITSFRYVGNFNTC